MTVFDEMREIRTAVARGDVLTDVQLGRACEIVRRRPTGSTSFAGRLILGLGLRVAEQRTLIAELSAALEEDS